MASPDLRWPTSPPITGALISIASKAPYLSERLAMTLEPKRKQALAFELDPIATGPVAWRNPTRGRGASIPTASGVDRAFRWMVEEVASAVDGDGELLIDRVVVGDLQTVTSSDSLYSWLAALRALAQLLSPYSAPVIMCTRLPGDAQTADRLQEQLSSCAESAVRLDVPGEGPNVTSVGAVISDMLTRVFDVVELPLPRDADRAR